jgi:hypothetical protein
MSLVKSICFGIMLRLNLVLDTQDIGKRVAAVLMIKVI